MIDTATTFATGFVSALALAVLVATPLFEAARKTLKRAGDRLQQANETIAAQQEDIESLFEITPVRLQNGRFAKRKK